MKAKKEEKTAQSEEPVKRRKKLVAPGGPERMEMQKQPDMVIAIQSWTTPIIAVVMLVIGLLVGYFGRPFTRSGSQPVAAQPGVITASAPPVVIPTADNSAAQQNLMETVVAQTRHFRGDPNALVTIIEFGDFQCPFCGRHAAIVGPQIDEKYIQSGKVRFGYWNFAFLGDESTWAAEAAECAADQDKFWEYHDIIYSSQSGENQGAFNKDNLKKFAQELGLETQAFNECLDSGKYTSLIQADTQASSAMGVQSTPTFLVNGQPVIGAQPFEVFQQTIDALLK